MEFQYDDEQPLGYWDPYREWYILYPTDSSTNSMPGMMFNNNACTQYAESPLAYSNTPPIYEHMVQPQHDTNMHYSSQPMMYVKPKSEQSLYTQELQLPVAEYQDPKREVETPLHLPPVVIKQATQDEPDNELKPTEFLYQSPEASYNTLPPHVMNQDMQLLRSAEHMQEEVIKAAKLLFSKKTRTLLHWLNPNLTTLQLKANVSAAWDILPDQEKSFYISQVTRNFSFYNSSLMVNPQLGTAQFTPISVPSNNPTTSKIIEDQSAVNSLFQSSDDAEILTSYTGRKYEKSSSKKEENDKKYSKKLQSEKGKNKRIFPYDPEFEQELWLPRKSKKKCQGLEEFSDDSKLVKKIEKLRLMSEEIDECFFVSASNPNDEIIDLCD